jgi:hypothetical protein
LAAGDIFMKSVRRHPFTLILCLIFLSFPDIAQVQTRPNSQSDQVRLLENWLLSHRGAASGLPISHVGDPRLKDWCFTYDAAVAALAFIAVNRLEEAKRIIDFYLHVRHTHRLGGFIEAVTVEPPYPGKDWSVRTGANIWLGLAAYHLYKATHEKQYLNLAARIADFAQKLQDGRPTSRTFGGIRMGPPGDPANEKDQHFGYDAHLPGLEQVFSTEATIDAFALFDMLGREPEMARFNTGRDRCLTWLKNGAWNPDDQRFNRGYREKPDYAVATDVQAWAISAIGVARLDTIEPGAAERMIRFVEEHCRSTVSYRSPQGRTVKVSGFDFVDHGALKHLKRPALVSAEWSFQMANAYKRMADDYNALGETGKAGLYFRKRIDLLIQLMAMATLQGDAAGFPYATLGEVPVGHEYDTPAKGSLSMIGTTYGILALTGYDPLRTP